MRPFCHLLSKYPVFVSHKGTIVRWQKVTCNGLQNFIDTLFVVLQLFQSRHAKRENVLTGNTVYFRMHNITDIYFVGGFGTVQWIDVADYILAQPDKIVQSNPHHTLHVRSYPIWLLCCLL